MQRISSHRGLVRAAMLVVAVGVLALAVAACGGSSSNSTTTVARKHHKTASRTRSTTSATATATSTSSQATATQATTTSTSSQATATQTTPPSTGTQTSGGGGAPVSPGQNQSRQTTPSHSCTSGPDCNPNGTPNVPGSSSPVNGKCPAGTTYVPPQDNGPALCVPSGTATSGGKQGAASPGAAAETTPSR